MSQPLLTGLPKGSIDWVQFTRYTECFCIVGWYLIHSIDTYICIVGHRAVGGLYRRSMGLLSQCVQYVLVVVVVVGYKNAKKLGQVVGNQTPRVDFEVGFHLGYVAWIQYITHTLYIYNIFVYLHCQCTKCKGRGCPLNRNCGPHSTNCGFF